ncbi:hypothetical protein PSU4_43860 [Pseudonocardia sulfidoxydans NBRC 16205]|uniref:DUF3093 domain-containing protein n=1 Tax=Pseudonocardia sulfidoxydans NBRC 16205 TaxID=1223511 RepID=A0A511DKV1_9PSEU|nr:hypothetical protein PSU4_43860 [Pseudonocardia sulfidoxydans NBRC 16205]
MWWYLVAAAIGVLIGAEIHMGYPGFRSWIGYVIAVPLLLGALFWLGRTRVRVDDESLTIAGETIPLSAVGRTDTVDKRDKQVALGPQLDPQAFLMHRAWVGPVVRIENVDPTIDEPYWIVSTRDPDKLRAVLAAARR